MCVWCMYVHMCVGTHVCMCMWKPSAYVDIVDICVIVYHSPFHY